MVRKLLQYISSIYIYILDSFSKFGDITPYYTPPGHSMTFHVYQLSPHPVTHWAHLQRRFIRFIQDQGPTQLGSTDQGRVLGSLPKQHPPEKHGNGATSPKINHWNPTSWIVEVRWFSLMPWSFFNPSSLISTKCTREHLEVKGC